MSLSAKPVNISEGVSVILNGDVCVPVTEPMVMMGARVSTATTACVAAAFPAAPAKATLAGTSMVTFAVEFGVGAISKV